MQFKDRKPFSEKVGYAGNTIKQHHHPLQVLLSCTMSRNWKLKLVNDLQMTVQKWQFADAGMLFMFNFKLGVLKWLQEKHGCKVKISRENLTRSGDIENCVKTVCTSHLRTGNLVLIFVYLLLTVSKLVSLVCMF